MQRKRRLAQEACKEKEPRRSAAACNKKTDGGLRTYREKKAGEKKAGEKKAGEKKTGEKKTGKKKEVNGNENHGQKGAA